MALFGRKQSNIDQVPQEVQEYYQSERRERAGVAWLLALATLGVTLLIAAALFLGGKWAYNKIAHHDTPKKTAATSQQNQDGQNDKSGSNSGNANNDSAASGATDQGGGTSQTSPSPTPTASPTPAPSAPTPSPSSSSTATSPAPASGNLVNTGPGEDMAVVFVIAGVAAFLIHRLHVARIQDLRSKQQ